MSTVSAFIRVANSILRNRLTLMHELSEASIPAVTKRKDKLIELIKEKSEVASKSEIARKIRVLKGYYTLEMAPPGAGEMEQLRADMNLLKDFFKKGCLKFLTVKQAWLLFLIATEVGLWFFLGETIGKMHIVGYQV